MEITQPPRRQAAIKATTNLAESSSDEDKNSGNETDDYRATTRVRGRKPKKEGRGTKKHTRKRPGVGSQGVDDPFAGTSAKKRKRGAAVNVGTQRKRHRGTGHTGSGLPEGDDVENDSELTPLSSDNEQQEVNRFKRPLAEFPLHFTPLAPNSKPKKQKRTKSEAIHFLEVLSLDEDSDDLPDIGMVLSQDVSTRKGKQPQKSSASNRKSRPKSKRKSPQNDSPFSFASSPALPPSLPPSSLPLSSRGNHFDDDLTTETNLSDTFDLSYLSYDSDLDPDSVSRGEYCFAKNKAADTVYWPAKVLEVKRPILGEGKGKQKNMFRVMFLDKKEKDIPRDWFYISSQEEFATCEVGQFKSSHIDVVNDIDDDLQQTSATGTGLRGRSPPHSRSPSPVDNPNPPLLLGPDFCDLPLHDQLPYVIPVLRAIMNEQVTWALQRHRMYLRGGAMRHKLMNEGGLRGAVDAKSADDMLGLVEKWCLGVRGRNFVGDEDEEIRTEDQRLQGVTDALQDGGENRDVDLPVSMGPPSGTAPPEAPTSSEVEVPVPEPVVQQCISPSTGKPPNDLQPSEAENPPESEPTETEPNSPVAPPLRQPPTIITHQNDQLPQPKRQRQRGSPGYEKLSPLEKVNYCLEVLLPETLNQILLWRTAERKSVEVMWDNVEEEERLHECGEALLRETDWVMDIMRLKRAVAEAVVNRKGKKGGEGVIKKQEKGLRKTRSGRVGSMVGSYKD